MSTLSAIYVKRIIDQRDLLSTYLSMTQLLTKNVNNKNAPQMKFFNEKI